MTPIAFIRLRNVTGNKKLPDEMVRHVQRVMAEYVAENCRDMSEREIGQQFGISQNTYNKIKNWQPRGAPPSLGATTLIAISKTTGLTIDAVLGRELPLPVLQRQEMLHAIIEKAEEITRLMHAEAPLIYGPTTKIGKLREEIRTLAAVAKSQRERDERIQKINDMPAPKSRRKAS